MTDETLQPDTTPTQDASTEPAPAAPPAEAQKPDTPAAEDHMIPKSRFDAVNQQLKELKATQEKAEKAAAAAKADELKQQNKFKELYEQAVTLQQEAEAKAAALELATMKRRIADEVKLPTVLAERLQGTTEEELAADAKKLLETLPKPAAPNLDGGAGKSGKSQPNAPTWVEIKEQAARFGVDPKLLAGTYGVVPPST